MSFQETTGGRILPPHEPDNTPEWTISRFGNRFFSAHNCQPGLFRPSACLREPEAFNHYCFKMRVMCLWIISRSAIGVATNEESAASVIRSPTITL